MVKLGFVKRECLAISIQMRVRCTFGAIFKNLDEQYSKDLEYRSELFGKLLEPFVILFISVIVGFIVIAMYIPMMEINTGLF